MSVLDHPTFRAFRSVASAAIAVVLLSATARAEERVAPPAEEEPVTLRWSGTGLSLRPLAEYMVRFRHFEGRDFTKGTSDDFIRHRARLGLDLDWRDRVGVLVQAQDVRIWGEEGNTLGDYQADGFDLHQGYIRVTPFDGFELRAGRQEIAYENQRLIGSVGWIEQARSFDAFRVSYQQGMLRLGSFYAKLSDDTAQGENPSNTDLIAGNLGLHPVDAFDVGAVGVLLTGGPQARRLATFGGIVSGKTSVGFSYELEGYGQLGGTASNDQHQAFLAAGALGYSAPLTTKPYIKAFANYLSGDESPGDADTRTFETLFATGHKFHGEMDFFLNIPVDTGEAGLLDAGGRTGLSPVDMLELGVTYHHFRSAVKQPDRGRTFGDEIDVGLKLKPWKYLSFDVLYGAFLPGDIFEQERGSDVEHFVYSTLHASL